MAKYDERVTAEATRTRSTVSTNEHGQWQYYYYARALRSENYLHANRIEEGLAEAEEILEIANRENHDYGRATALRLMGFTYSMAMRTPLRGAEVLRQAIDILAPYNDHASLTQQYYVYMDLIHSYLDVYANKKSDTATPATLEGALAGLETVLDRLDRLAEDTPEKINDRRFNFYSQSSLVNLQTKNYERAEEYIRRMQLMASDNNQTLQAIRQELWLHEKRGNYTQALALIDTLESRYRATPGNERALTMMFADKARLHKRAGNFEQSVEALMQRHSLTDSIQRVEMNARLDEIRTQYEVDRHVAEKTRNRTYALLFAVAFALALVALAIWIGYSRSLRRKNIRLVAQIQEQDRLRREKETLQTRLSTRTEPGTGTLPEDDLFQRLEQLMKTENLYLDPNLNIKTLLPLLGTNERYLREAIREQTGATFLDYVNDLRLTHSRQLLEDAEKYTIEAIATESGFNSRSTFHRVFRDKYGLAPDEYRKLQK